MTKVPVMLFDRLSGDCEIVFVESDVLAVTLNGKNFKVAVDKRALITVATFANCSLFTMYVNDRSELQQVVHAKFKRDILKHTLYRDKPKPHSDRSVKSHVPLASRLCKCSVA